MNAQHPEAAARHRRNATVGQSREATTGISHGRKSVETKAINSIKSQPDGRS